MSGPAILARTAAGGAMVGMVQDRAGNTRDLEDGWGWADAAVAAVDLGSSVLYAMTRPDGVEAQPDGEYRIVVPVASPSEDGKCATVINVVVIDLAADVDHVTGPWSGLTANELYRAFAVFERFTSVPWGSSVGQTVERLIRATHPASRGGRQLDRGAAVVPEVAQDRALEGPYFHWRRELTAEESEARYMHGFDQRAQYLAAWGTAELGHGQPAHHVRPLFDPRRAGLWRILPADLPPTMEPLLPTPWLEDREWFATPTVQRLLEVCVGMDAPTIAEAWVWPERSRYLRATAERLNVARMSAEGAVAAARVELADLDDDIEAYRVLHRQVVAGVVLDAVKSCYQREHGRMMAGWRDPASGFARPDWAHTIMSTARVNLHRRITSLGRYPFAIMVDGLLFASDEPDPVKFAEQIRLPIGNGLGQFKHSGTTPIGAAIEAMSESPVSLVPVFAAIKGGSL